MAWEETRLQEFQPPRTAFKKLSSPGTARAERGMETAPQGASVPRAAPGLSRALLGSVPCFPGY